MKRIDLSEIACRSCGTRQDACRFGGRCSTCGKDRFDLRVQRSFRGLDWRGSADALLGLAALPLPFILVDWAAGETFPLFASRSEDDLGDLSGEEVSEFLGLADSGRRALFVQWKRRQAEASRPADRHLCGRCAMGFTPVPNPWHGKGYCSRKCLEVAELSGR
ncbi:MAG TPA: hypothetical protein VK661_02580 [Planctomycetota bacterium]|jgi:hypothetical protein|nr:hypothetical protein [Planctomycetota bacterium]